MRPLVRLYVVKPTDSRGWIGLGCYGLVLVILGMIAADKTLLENNAFLVLATAIVITGWNQGPVGWAFQATKSGGEAAESSARIAEEAATAAIKTSPRKAAAGDGEGAIEPDVILAPGETAQAQDSKETKP